MRGRASIFVADYIILQAAKSDHAPYTWFSPFIHGRMQQLWRQVRRPQVRAVPKGVRPQDSCWHMHAVRRASKEFGIAVVQEVRRRRVIFMPLNFARVR